MRIVTSLAAAALTAVIALPLAAQAQTAPATHHVHKVSHKTHKHHAAKVHHAAHRTHHVAHSTMKQS
jgi:hypothetical protein